MKNMESAENTKDTELFSNSVPFASSTVRSILNGIVYANPRNTCSVLKFCNKLIRSNLFPFQRSRAGLRDTHVDEITDTVRTSVEHHHTVLLRTAEQLVARTLGNSFYITFPASCPIRSLRISNSLHGMCSPFFIGCVKKAA